MDKWPEPDPNAKGIPAATVIIFRNCPDGGSPQVLMVIRSKAMRFAGGAAVFPGGKVDDADHVLAASIGGDDLEDLAARIAGIRETLEETGLLIGIKQKVTSEEAAVARELILREKELAPVLAHFGWELDPTLLVPFARWFPKVKSPKIFDARFYIANLGTGNVDVAIDQTENTRLFWTAANKALDMADVGEVSIIFPTRRNLERLAQFASFGEAEDHARVTPIQTITPWVDQSGEEPVLRIPEGLGYPVTFEPVATVMRAIPLPNETK